MKKNYFYSALVAGCLVIAAPVLAQKNYKIIHATSETVDIRDGRNYFREVWSIAPHIKPDVYLTQQKKTKVTFITDQDSLSFMVKPKQVINFNIVLNGKDTAWTQIKYEPSYLSKLTAAKKYNFSDHRFIPKFTYQSPNAPELVALRSGLHLDSIAGTGSELSKILNLLHWIHALIPHDGNHENPVVKNALHMIAVCKQEQRGLNCRGLATVLNECYLSLGIKSRFITCMPKDSIFNDCHVINLVWASELNKWIWIDPTNDAYVMDENGLLLSPEEVRDRLIRNRPLILNPDANWNRKMSVTKEDYLYHYMAKNLYRIECPVVSEYDTESWQNGKKLTYVELLPLDAFAQTPQYSEFTNKKLGVTFINYKTNNPSLFWEKPE